MQFNIQAIKKTIEEDNILEAYFLRYIFVYKIKDKTEAYRYIFHRFIENDRFFAYEYRKHLSEVQEIKEILTA